MRHALAWLTTVIAVALLASCGESETTGLGRIAEEFDWSGTIAQAERIEIKNMSGNVRATYTEGSEVAVHATKTGRDSDPASVKIEVVRHTEGVTICAVYPDVPGHAPNECVPGFGGNMTTRNNDVSVEFTLQIPAGVDYVARVVAGDIVADDLRSDAFARTVSGHINISTRRIATASAVSGSVSATIGRGDPGRDLSFTATSGDVTLRVPSNTNARVTARTGNGRIDSDFHLEGSASSRTGVLGSGGPMLTLSTLNGDVGLRRGPAAQR